MLPEQKEGKWSGLSDEVKALCKGNGQAIHFCSLWFLYCHRIDDLIDNRTGVTNDEILEMLLCAAAIYNCDFYIANRQMLYPIVLMVTNQFADSVAWENDSVEHRRKMADVLRCCGNEMFFAVAMLVGGWGHVRIWSPKIRERDWLLQHDEKGNPE